MTARGYSAAQPVYLSDRPQPVEVHLSKEDSAMFASSPDLLDVLHLRVLLGQSEKTIRKLIAEGELPSCTIGERVYVPKARLIEYIVAQCEGASHE